MPAVAPVTTATGWGFVGVAMDQFLALQFCCGRGFFTTTCSVLCRKSLDCTTNQPIGAQIADCMWLRWGSIALETSSRMLNGVLVHPQSHLNRLLATPSLQCSLRSTSYLDGLHRRFAHGFGGPDKCFTSYRLRECVRAAAIPDSNGKPSSSKSSSSSVEYVCVP